MVEPPSLPCSFISLSCTAEYIAKSLDELYTLPNSVPPSLNIMSAPSASRDIVPATSSVRSPEVLAMFPVTAMPVEVVASLAALS